CCKHVHHCSSPMCCPIDFRLHCGAGSRTPLFVPQFPSWKGTDYHRERLAPKYGNTVHGGRVCLSWPSSDNGTVEPGRDCVSGRRVSCLCLTSVSTVAKEPSAPGAEPPRGAAKPRKPGPCIYGAPYLIWPNCMRRWPNRPSATARSQPSEMFAMTQIADRSGRLVGSANSGSERGVMARVITIEELEAARDRYVEEIRKLEEMEPNPQ